MTAIEALLDGLIDYAGVYPPASLDLGDAVSHYLCYKRSKHAQALGRFVIDGTRIGELRQAAASAFAEIPLAVCVSPATDWDSLHRDLAGFTHPAVFEVKNAEPVQVSDIISHLPNSTAYFEVPLGSHSSALLDAVCSSGARVKLRMGGVVATAIPSALATVTMLRSLAERHLAFKATAGLHHPIRSRHPLTYAADSPVDTMHGFLNLFCAAAAIHSGGDEQDACAILNESDPAAWQASVDSIACRSRRFSQQQIREVRREFFVSFGSCSFDEPIADLEALRWL